jgi:hypothetical protein
VSWRAWLTTSSTALRIDRGLALAAGFAALLAAVVAAATLVTKTPLSGIETLLIPAFPLLMVGQLWTIGILNARLAQPAGGWWARWTAQVPAQQNPRTFLFGGLPAWAAYALMAAILSGWVAAVTAFPGLSLWNPGEGAPGCPWPLVNHGFATCVSHARYQAAAAAGERALAGILMFFFVTHAGVAASEVARHRS